MDLQYNSSHIGAPRTLDTNLLIENLKNGELSIASAINQMSAIVREVLKVIEEYAEEQTRANIDRKLKVEKMDKIINDLSEKCQGMQQALLYKEEKYDEKCREVERYKVICELSAKAAVSENPYYTSRDRDENYNCPDSKNGIVKLEGQYCAPPEVRQDGTNKLSKGHIKLSRFLSSSKNSVDPIRSSSPKSCVNVSVSAYGDDDDRRSLMAPQYAGGPIRRNMMPSSNLLSRDSRLKDSLENIGAINVRGPRIEQGPVQISKLNRPRSDLFSDDQNKKFKISLSGQNNAVLSSSGDSAHQMKQKISEKDYYRHIQGGIWTKMSGRRKKEWPF